MRILIIEDDASLIALYSKVLGGNDISIATSKKEALEFKDESFDLIITDLWLPDITEQNEMIELLGEYPHVIFTSIEQGGNKHINFIKKDFNLLAKIKKAIND